MQLGFVIDHSRCIGCHACTVACKSENNVPLGSFRTWVKYTERGAFPSVKRSFAVLRCNQCSAAPCVTICPTRALEKRPDGIVDIDPKACIGCKSCMQGCPYDALYINEGSGTAEKCHFCAHRTELGLAPACAIVCPTEAIIPGDFDDPQSLVSRLRDGGGLQARKREAGTNPNVLYREVETDAIDPMRTHAAGGYLWAEQRAGAWQEVEAFRAAQDNAFARTTYDVDHTPYWGWRVSAYLWTKSISAGCLLAANPLFFLGEGAGRAVGWAAFLSLLFLVATTALLIADLKRPERFLYILKRPNWSSWLVRGTVVLMAHGAAGALWLGLAATGSLPDPETVGAGLMRWSTYVIAALAGCYTAFLFAQAKGRVLWMQRGLWATLIAQAAIGGSAFLLVAKPLLAYDADAASVLRWILAGALVVQLAMSFAKGMLAPRGREIEYRQACALLTKGPFRERYNLALALAGYIPLVVLLVSPAAWAWAFAGAVALAGLYFEEDVRIRAGQALPIS